MLSAMKFEIHKATLNHLKLKARKSETSDDVDLHDLDLGDFKTVDSVGDVDGEEGSLVFNFIKLLYFKADFFKLLVESGDEDEFDSAGGPSASGQDFVNKIEVNYCSLCREYLPRISKDDAKVIADHCKTKRHLKWYYQSKKKEESDLKDGEAFKEDVTSTSVQENDESNSKNSPEKEVSATGADVALEVVKIKEEVEETEKFTR